MPGPPAFGLRSFHLITPVMISIIALYRHVVRQGFAITSRKFGSHGSCMDACISANTDMLKMFQIRKIEVHIAVRAGC